jgi:hypothetical protein
MKQQLKKKLLTYSSLGSAIALIAARTDAQIVYVDPPDITINSGIYDLDLNNDGIYDFRFYDTEDFSGYNKIVFNGNDYYRQILAAEDCDFYQQVPRIIPAGEVIKRNAAGDHWRNISYSNENGLFCSDLASCTYPGWKGKSKKFFGFRFINQPNQSTFYYGWMRVSVAPDCHTLKIHDWAYNSEQGKSIVAGQTMRIGSGEEDHASDLFVHADDRTLHIDNNMRQETLQVFIYNLSGQLLQQLKTADTGTEVDLHEFPAGMLLVHIQGSQVSDSWKVVIE